MAKWWYLTLYRCPDCKVTWEVYDPSGGNYDSGRSACSPAIEELCEECLVERRLADELENL